MRIILLGLVAYMLLTHSCTPEQKPDAPKARRYMGLPPAPDCWHLYNKNRTDEWVECMGVGER